MPTKTRLRRFSTRPKGSGTPAQQIHQATEIGADARAIDERQANDRHLHPGFRPTGQRQQATLRLQFGQRVSPDRRRHVVGAIRNRATLAG